MDANETLASLKEVRAQCRTTLDRCEGAEDTAQQTLNEIRYVLDRWDNAKAKFGRALDNAARRIAESMQDYGTPEPTGPPSGPTAHGFDAPDGLSDPHRIVECDVEARPKMMSGILVRDGV